MTGHVQAVNAISENDRATPYYARLDGLRGLAVIGVLLEHFTYSPIIRDWSPGMIGVRTFFVLSGFLITSILLRDRQKPYDRSQLAVNFYWKRFVRLAPALVVAVAVLALLDLADMRHSWWVHLLYLSNFQIAHVQYWIDAGHFWSLAVEEQFYLLWFPIVVLAPRKWLLPVIIAAIVVSPLYRTLIPLGMNEFKNVLLPGQIDSLAFGALVAYARVTPNLRWLDQLFASAWLLGLSIVATLVLSSPVGFSGYITWPLAPLCIALAAACMVRACTDPGKNWLAWMEHPILVRVGVISYGIYVYHYFVPQVMYAYAPPGLTEFLTSDTSTKMLRSFIWLVVTIVVAELSWRLLEKPALRLKTLSSPARGKSRAVPS